MKKTLFVALMVFAGIAQAAEVNLSCEYTGVDGSQQVQTVVFDPALGSGSAGKLNVTVQAAGQNYVLTETRIGIRYIVNRENLSLKIESFGKTFNGQCQLAKSKNKI